MTEFVVSHFLVICFIITYPQKKTRHANILCPGKGVVQVPSRRTGASAFTADLTYMSLAECATRLAAPRDVGAIQPITAQNGAQLNVTIEMPSPKLYFRNTRPWVKFIAPGAPKGNCRVRMNLSRSKRASLK